jgi:hypothetical protein
MTEQVGDVRLLSRLATADARPGAKGSPVTGHQPIRPQWTCSADADAWPCTLVRTVLTQYYRDDHQALARHMLLVVARAAEDLGVGPASLYWRFVRWSLPSNSACRACGRSGHDVLPGVPPRLFGCDDRVIPPVHDPKKCDQGG